MIRILHVRHPHPYIRIIPVVVACGRAGVMLNYAGEYCAYGEYCDVGMHEAGAVPTRVLRNEATLPFMCVGVRE